MTTVSMLLRMVSRSAGPRMRGLAAAHHSGQKLGGEEQAVALVQRERQERPAFRLVVREHDLRVGRRLALCVHERPCRNPLALVEGDPDLAQCDHAGRHVQEKRLVSRRCFGHPDVQMGLVPKRAAAMASAVGRDQAADGRSQGVHT